MNYNPDDTICAPATALGGALGVIRVSGPDAFSIVASLVGGEASKLCIGGDASKLCNPSVHHTHIITANDVIDDVLLTLFHAPRSYTGEDVAEFSCHGSSYIINKVLELLVQNGCRMAYPGEFTMRAYLNGKMDLSQAEAVADLIAARNKATHNMAMSQLRGHFSSELACLRDQLLKLTSLLELELDFSDHEDLEFADRSELLALAQTTYEHITRLAKSFETGQALKHGIPVAIVGKTNVGKSTLLNALLKDERAIVSAVHGTTRDTVEDTIDIKGVSFRFIDTAGIRQTTDEIEKIGIDRTYAAIEKARIVLWLLDSPPSDNEVARMTSRCQGRSLIPVWNKADLRPPCCPHVAAIPISAKLGQGIEALEARIYAAADIPELNDDNVIVVNSRHYEALTIAHNALFRVIDGLQQQTSSVLLAEDLRQVLDALAEIAGGQITPQETLSNIFSHFCVGK